MLIEEVYINRDKGHRIGESGIYETRFDNVGELFRFLQREYGRCTSRIYIDKADGRTVPIGWVFEGRDRYTDTDETYIREVWVSVYAAQTERATREHYLDIGTRRACVVVGGWNGARP